MIGALILYVVAILEDGDFQNDWLTHLPPWSADAVATAGQALAVALGY
jgi:hypothetical protein